PTRRSSDLDRSAASGCGVGRGRSTTSGQPDARTGRPASGGRPCAQPTRAGPATVATRSSTGRRRGAVTRPSPPGTPPEERHDMSEDVMITPAPTGSGWWARVPKFGGTPAATVMPYLGPFIARGLLTELSLLPG